MYFWFKTQNLSQYLWDLEQVTYLELTSNIGKLLFDYYMKFVEESDE